MTAKGLLTRLAFSLVLAAVTVPWAMGQARGVRPQFVQYGVWTDDGSYGPNMYHYLGPIEPYAQGSFPLDNNYADSDEWWSGSLFQPPRFNPALPGSVPAPWQYAAPDWYYRQPYYWQPAYPPPFYGGYYYPPSYYSYPRSAYPRYYGYSDNWSGNNLAWRRYMRSMRARPNADAPTEVPHN
jgi:hypothetical protein